MKLTLIRETNPTHCQFGVLFIDGKYFCLTLENTELRIQEGTFLLELYLSPKFKRQVPLLKNVTGREYIEIHPANFYTELEGCIAVGSSKSDTMLLNSRDMFDKLLALLATQEDNTISVMELT